MQVIQYEAERILLQLFDTIQVHIVTFIYIYTFIYTCLQLFIKVNTPHRTSTANTLLGINGMDNYPYLTVIKDHARSLIAIQLSHTSVFSEQYHSYYNTRCF